MTRKWSQLSITRRRFKTWLGKGGRKYKEILFNEQKGLCKICGIKMLLTLEKGGNEFIMATYDHIVPINKGGNNNVENLQLLCKSCNEGKNQTEDPEFGGKLNSFHKYL